MTDSKTQNIDNEKRNLYVSNKKSSLKKVFIPFKMLSNAEFSKIQSINYSSWEF